MAIQIQIRRDTAANWTSENPIPASGEPCFETDTGVLKFGDGTTLYNSLAAFSSGSGNNGAATFVVASSEAPAAIKARADYECNGTDDQDTINTALALGSVQLTDGSYYITAPIKMEYPNSSLIGTGRSHWQDAGTTATGWDGRECRIVVDGGWTEGATANTPAIEVRQSDDYIVGGITIRDLCVDGNPETVDVVDGILFSAHSSLIENVKVRYMSGNGIRCRGNDITDWDMYETGIIRCEVRHTTGHALLLEAGDAAGSGATDMQIEGCVFHSSGAAGSGIEITGGASEQITNCHMYGNQFGIHFNGGGSRTKIVNCKIEGNDKGGIAFNTKTGRNGTSEVQITGNGIAHNGSDGALGTWAQIGCYETDNPTNGGAIQHTSVNVVGNTFTAVGSPATSYAKNNIYLGTKGVGWNIVGNQFKDSLNGSGIATGFGPQIHYTSTDARDSIHIAANRGTPDFIYPDIITSTLVTATMRDAERQQWMNNASAITVTMPPSSDEQFVYGTKFEYFCRGAGGVTIAGGTGVTFVGTPNKSISEGEALTVLSVAWNLFAVIGGTST